MIHRIRTIDSHAAGEPLRLIVEGLPSPEGDTMLAKRAWAQKHIDHLRRSLMLEPRGHTDMYGALLTASAIGDLRVLLALRHVPATATVEFVTEERGYRIVRQP